MRRRKEGYQSTSAPVTVHRAQVTGDRSQEIEKQVGKEVRGNGKEFGAQEGKRQRNKDLHERQIPNTERRKEVEEMTMKRAMKTTVPLGFVRVIETAAGMANDGYDLMAGKMSLVKEAARGRDIEIEIDEMPEELKPSLEKLMDVVDVEVKVPGVDFAIAERSKGAPTQKYDVKEEIFTINKITLEKTPRGALVVRVPSGAKKDLDEKVLCLSKEKNEKGLCIEERIKQGEVEAIAMVLAEWAKYASSGFVFDEETEVVMAKAIIKVVGVGMENSLVRLENEESTALILEGEVKKIIGDDADAWERIRGFMYPGRDKDQ